MAKPIANLTTFLEHVVNDSQSIGDLISQADKRITEHWYWQLLGAFDLAKQLDQQDIADRIWQAAVAVERQLRDESNEA